MTAPRKVYVPVVPRVRVRCEHDHTLFGLFVLHRPEGSTEPFTLSFVGSEGFLQVVTPGDDPWPCFYKPNRAAPQTPKLVRGRYDIVAVRHPDVRVARSLADSLRDLAAVRAFGEAHPGVLKPRELETVEHRGRRYLTLTLPEDAGAYLPRGSVLYDHWTLYADMPHAACEPVRRAVRRLRVHLGALAYVTGAQEAPFAPEAAPTAKPGVTPTPILKSIETFDAGLLNAVVTFQANASRGRAWAMSDPDGAMGALLDRRAAPFEPVAPVGFRAASEASWKALRGNVTRVAQHDTAVDGVVDDATAAAVAAWITAGVRRAGAMLVAVAGAEGDAQSWVYLRLEAALAFEAWRAAVVAMGCAYGLASGHSFRAISSGVNTQETGVASQSLHKTGLAIDLAVKGSEGAQIDYAYPIATWPVVFEREVLPEKVHLSNGATSNRIAWRLFGHSTVNVAGFIAPTSEARDALVDALRTAASNYVSRIGARVGRAFDRDDVTLASLCPLVVAQAATMRALASEAAEHPEEFLARFFRGSVFPWRYDPFHDDAGTLGPELSPDAPVKLAYANASIATTVTRAEARSFVNLSALGQRFGMLRIRAASKGWQSEVSDSEQHTVYKTAQAILADQHLPFVVDRLRKLNALTLRDAVVRIVNSDERERSVPLADLDVDALEQWVIAVGHARKQRPASVSLCGAQVSIDLGLGKQSRASVDALLSAMQGALAGVVLRLVSGVDFTADGIQGVALQLAGDHPASAWAEEIAALRDRLDVATRARKTEGAGRRSTARRKGDWSIELHPLVVRGASDVLFMAPSQRVILPASGSGRALEWWHFQHVSANRRPWFDLIEEIGFWPDVLGQGRSPALHHRAGIGYDAKNWMSTTHSTSDGPVENQMRALDRTAACQPAAKRAGGSP